jgi:Anti-sigma-K factor rskA, C-terminal/Sigma-70, region 4
MASLDTLPSDQRAVLELVLRRGRSYDDIARLLSIDRAAVRQRALAALDAIGPETGVPPERRALITDYLLGQLPARVSEDLRERLAESGSERAWARVIASELAPVASNPLPEIPAESARREPVQAAGERSAAPSPPPPTSEPSGGEKPREPSPPARRSSRRGGAVLLGVAGAVVIAAIVVVIVLVAGGSSSKHPSTASRSGTASSSTTATPIAQINLAAPNGGKATGVAFVVRQGTNTGILIRAANIPPNGKHDAYAVWLYNSPTDTHILGFVNPGVGKNGQLTTAGGLPSNASHFGHVIVTLETTGNPRTPGQIVLEGTLTGV